VEKNVFYEEFSAKPFFGCTLCLGFLRTGHGKINWYACTKRTAEKQQLAKDGVKNSSVRWSWNESCTPSTCGRVLASSEFGRVDLVILRQRRPLGCGFSDWFLRTFRKVVNLLFTEKNWLKSTKQKTKEASKPLLLLHVQYVYCSLAFHHGFYLLRSERKSHPVRLDKQNTPGSHPGWVGNSKVGWLSKSLTFQIRTFRKVINLKLNWTQKNEFTDNEELQTGDKQAARAFQLPTQLRLEARPFMWDWAVGSWKDFELCIIVLTHKKHEETSPTLLISKFISIVHRSSLFIIVHWSSLIIPYLIHITYNITYNITLNKHGQVEDEITKERKKPIFNSIKEWETSCSQETQPK
jgi:hypothetical protein